MIEKRTVFNIYRYYVTDNSHGAHLKEKLFKVVSGRHKRKMANKAYHRIHYFVVSMKGAGSADNN